MMTPEEIRFIREWARSGNEPRPSLYLSDQTDTWERLFDAGALDVHNDRLNEAGLTIAALSEALEQAGETAESFYRAVDRVLVGPDDRKELETMRENKRRLLG